MKEKRKTVAIALSGGIDSACAAAVLKNEGWDVAGVHLLLPISNDRVEKMRICAGNISKRLGIPLYNLDVRNAFQRDVIDYFIRTYYQGLTPNPCVVCNHRIKFEQILGWIDEEGIEFLATGHYARTWKRPGQEKVDLLKGWDGAKDQSYFLHRLDNSWLSRTVFPLGESTKEEVRQLAQQEKLLDLVHHDSQEICFIPRNGYREFLDASMPVEKGTSAGNILDIEGNVLGVHTGTHAYTVGQRHGLGIASRRPLYVCQIRPGRNEIIVGHKEKLFGTTITAQDFNWIAPIPAESKLIVKGQIRYRHQPAEGMLTVISEEVVRMEFDRPQWAITPGQALVCYKGERVLGGGWIKKAEQDVKAF